MLNSEYHHLGHHYLYILISSWRWFKTGEFLRLLSVSSSHTETVKGFIFLPSVSIEYIFISFTQLVFNRTLETEEWKVMIFVCESVPDEMCFMNCLMNSFTLFLQTVIRRWGSYFSLLKKHLFPVRSPLKAIEKSCLWASILSLLT